MSAKDPLLEEWIEKKRKEQAGLRWSIDQTLRAAVGAEEKPNAKVKIVDKSDSIYYRPRSFGGPDVGRIIQDFKSQQDAIELVSFFGSVIREVKIDANPDGSITIPSDVVDLMRELRFGDTVTLKVARSEDEWVDSEGEEHFSDLFVMVLE